MAKDGNFDPAARARWLKELGAGLREAERLTTALAPSGEEVLEVILLRARIAAAKKSLHLLEGETSRKSPGEIDPFWTIPRKPFDQSP